MSTFIGENDVLVGGRPFLQFPFAVSGVAVATSVPGAHHAAPLPPVGAAHMHSNLSRVWYSQSRHADMQCRLQDLRMAA